MNALPSLNGSVGYIFTSCDLDVKGSGDVRFKDMIDRFRVHDHPMRPEGKEEVWHAGERIDTRGEHLWPALRHFDWNCASLDYLLYGRLYIPTGRLDALYSVRVTPTTQAMIAAISDPRSSLLNEHSRVQPGPSSNVMLSLQHDTGKWCTEYTWSAEDGMWGVRCLHNFGKLGSSGDHSDEGAATATRARSKPKRVDEEDAMEGGLKGRISAGAEFYFSAKEKSAGGQSSMPTCCSTSCVSCHAVLCVMRSEFFRYCNS